MTSEERFMKRALDLAQLGKGKVSPNPMVGCVVVHQGLIIGEGYHQQYGGPHAEVNAIQSVEDREKLNEATVYVSLEPCSHFGKTPPCADLLVESQVKKVVICNLDPNPLVAGRGIQKLRDAGIEVVEGVLAEEGHLINQAFFTFMSKKRPAIILKWAQTADGYVARDNFDSKWISNSLSRKWVHKWRAEVDAIMVGTNTAHYDNPKLNVRSWHGNHPLRVVLDKQLRLSNSLSLFDQSIPTVCYNLKKAESLHQLDYALLSNTECLLEEILADLYQRKCQSLFVEGGSKLLNTFISLDLWDEARVFKSLQSFGSGIPAPGINQPWVEERAVIQDRLYIYRNTD